MPKIRETKWHLLHLDKTDLKILQVLQENGTPEPTSSFRNGSLYRRRPACAASNSLKTAGIIRKYAALLSPVAVELGLQAFIRVSISKAKVAREEFSAAVQTWPEVLSCFALTGETDYLLHAFFTDMNAFSHFVLDTLLSHEGVQDAQSSFVLKEIKTPPPCR